MTNYRIIIIVLLIDFPREEQRSIKENNPYLASTLQRFRKHRATTKRYSLISVILRKRLI